jgi:hypothetical protein
LLREWGVFHQHDKPYDKRTGGISHYFLVQKKFPACFSYGDPDGFVVVKESDVKPGEEDIYGLEYNFPARSLIFLSLLAHYFAV